jgi:ketosteroid isomerase-like protein
MVSPSNHRRTRPDSPVNDRGFYNAVLPLDHAIQADLRETTTRIQPDAEREPKIWPGETMIRFVWLAQLLVSIMIVGSASAAEADLRLQLEAQYAAMTAAKAAHDANAISTLLTPDFISVDSSNQSEDAARMIQEVVALPLDSNKNSHTTLISITNAGDIAVVEQRHVVTTKKIGSDGKIHDVKMDALSTDTWVNSDGTWRLKRSVTNRMDYAIDGQVVVHKIRPN